MTSTAINIHHIIVAAGSGSRYGSDVPKQFCPLDGQPVVMHAIRRLRQCGGDIWLVINPDWIQPWKQMCADYNLVSPHIVAGGPTRWHSVSNALAEIPDDAEIITVHDGARPLVDPTVTMQSIEAVRCGYDGAIPVTPVTDSVRITDNSGSHALDRSRLRAVHTPQVFSARLLHEAYRLPWSPLFTDDASVMETAGFSHIALIEDTPRNIKITHPGDIALAELYLKS